MRTRDSQPGHGTVRRPFATGSYGPPRLAEKSRTCHAAHAATRRKRARKRGGAGGKVGTDDRIEKAGLLYESAVFGGDAEALAIAERGLDAVEADLALARGRILHARFLEGRNEDPDELPLFRRAARLYRALGDARAGRARLCSGSAASTRSSGTTRVPRSPPSNGPWSSPQRPATS